MKTVTDPEISYVGKNVVGEFFVLPGKKLGDIVGGDQIIYKGELYKVSYVDELSEDAAGPGIAAFVEKL